MFTVTEAEAIRIAFDQYGEVSAVVEPHRLFLAVTNHTQARACVRTIAGWQPVAVAPPHARRHRKLPRF